MSKASLELGGGNWGTKDGNLLGYAQGNESSKFIPREFTFTRGSDIAATRINSSGLIEKYRENLLLQSNQFDTTWVLSSTSVTSGQSGYDSSSDAWLLNSTTTGFPRIEQNVTSSGVATYSVYAKPATDGFILMRTFGADSSVWFNLTNGTIPNAGGGQYITSNIQSVGNGWYRCSVTFNGSLTSLRVYPASAYGVYSTSGNGVYIQDAQLERGLVATSYLESGATTATSGVADNEPRIDYAGGTASLLLEPQRTNSILYSEALLSYNTFKTIGSEVTLSYTTNTTPEGLNSNVTTVLEGGATSNHRCYFEDIEPCTIGSTYSFSVFAKSIKGRNVRIGDGGKGFEVDTIVDLSDGSILTDVNNNVSVEDYGNGWYKISAFGTNNSIHSSQRLFINSVDGTTLSFAGDTTKGFLLWGAQFEEGSYATSYIPTYGTSVTRSEDTTAEKIFSSPYGSSNTWFFELKRITDSSLQNQSISILKNDSTGANNRFTIYSTNNGRFRVLLSDGGGTTENLFSPNNSFEKGETIKAVVKITPSGCTLFVDGSSVATSSSVGTITGIDAITYFRKAALKQFLIFPTALSDAECITLTT